MATWEDLENEAKANVLAAMRANAAQAGVTLTGPVRVVGEGEELVIPDGEA